MNSVDMANNLIFRAKHLNEFTITTEVPDNFRFNGLVPFDIQIKDGIITANVWAVDFDEAALRLDNFLGTCK
jgi:hypothetical protein